MNQSASADIIFLPSFERSSKKLFSSQERKMLADHVSLNPQVGDIIPGTGGIRKLRWAAKGKGKRSGSRVIYFYYVNASTVFMLFAYAKKRTGRPNIKAKIAV